MPEGRRLVLAEPRRVELRPFDVPAPGPWQVQVHTTRTLVSAGTEIKA